MVDSEQSNNNKKVIDVHRTLRLLLNWISSRKLKCGKEKREKLNLQKLEEKGSTVRYLEGGKEKIQDNCSVEIQNLCFRFQNKKKIKIGGLAVSDAICDVVLFQQFLIIMLLSSRWLVSSVQSPKKIHLLTHVIITALFS